MSSGMSFSIRIKKKSCQSFQLSLLAIVASACEYSRPKAGQIRRLSKSILSCSSYSMSAVQGPRLQLHRDPCL